MFELMTLQLRHLEEAVSTELAGIGPLVAMHSHVILEVRVCFETL